MSHMESNLQAELEACLRFEMLLAELSSKFINLPASELDSQIDNAQRQVCQCLGFDLAVLWRASGPARDNMVLTHFYRSFDGPPVPDRMSARDHFPWFMQQALAGRLVAISSLEQLPPAAARDREVFACFGIKTTLNIPLSTGGGPVLGVVSFNDVKQEREWPEAQVTRLKLVAQIFANAIARTHTEEALRDSEQRPPLAADSAGAGLWSLDLATGVFGSRIKPANCSS